MVGLGHWKSHHYFGTFHRFDSPRIFAAVHCWWTCFERIPCILERGRATRWRHIDCCCTRNQIGCNTRSFIGTKCWSVGCLSGGCFFSGFASPHMENFCMGNHHALMGSVSTRRPPRWMMKPWMFARKHRLQLAEHHLTVFFHGIFLFLLHHFRWFGDFKSMKIQKTTCFLTMAQNFDTVFLDQNSSCVVLIGDSLLVPRILFEPSFDYVTYLILAKNFQHNFGERVLFSLNLRCLCHLVHRWRPFGYMGWSQKRRWELIGSWTAAAGWGFGMNVSTWRRCLYRCWWMSMLKQHLIFCVASW